MSEVGILGLKVDDMFGLQVNTVEDMDRMDIFGLQADEELCWDETSRMSPPSPSNRELSETPGMGRWGTSTPSTEEGIFRLQSMPSDPGMLRCAAKPSAEEPTSPCAPVLRKTTPCQVCHEPLWARCGYVAETDCGHSYCLECIKDVVSKCAPGVFTCVSKSCGKVVRTYTAGGHQHALVVPEDGGEPAGGDAAAGDADAGGVQPAGGTGFVVLNELHGYHGVAAEERASSVALAILTTPSDVDTVVCAQAVLTAGRPPTADGRPATEDACSSILALTTLLTATRAFRQDHHQEGQSEPMAGLRRAFSQTGITGTPSDLAATAFGGSSASLPLERVREAIAHATKHPQEEAEVKVVVLNALQEYSAKDWQARLEGTHAAFVLLTTAPDGEVVCHQAIIRKNHLPTGQEHVAIEALLAVAEGVGARLEEASKLAPPFVLAQACHNVPQHSLKERVSHKVTQKSIKRYFGIPKVG